MECPKCGKKYKRSHYYDKHVESCVHKPGQKMLNGRQCIAAKTRKAVWDTYVGPNKTETRCFCCRTQKITLFSNVNHYQCGHILSDKEGGKPVVDNLLPICQGCNSTMGAVHWDKYVEYNDLPLRVRGYPVLDKIEWATTIIQSLVRMWLERKYPNSGWRTEWRRRLFST